ncbi:MAG: hypothetical protein WC184_04150 [Acidimicrobiia bacterium]
MKAPTTPAEQPIKAQSSPTSLVWIMVYLALSAWALRWLWGPNLTPGIDTGGHLTRLDAAWNLFQSGHLDGWFDQVSLGYQMHRLYGPGFAFIVATTKAVSFGLLSIPGAYKAVGALSTLAIPFTGMALCRSLGLKPNAAWLGGALMLAVSSPFSSGLEGAFLMGLMPQQVAAPLVLGAWALTIAARPRPVMLGITVALLTVTHPYSLVIYVFFGIFLLGAAALRSLRIHWFELIKAALVALTLSAWWWIPAISGSDLRGPLTGWSNPAFLEHLKLAASGERGIFDPVAALTVLSIGGVAVVAVIKRRLALAVLALLPFVLMAALHLVVYLSIAHLPEAMLFPNRGLTFAAYLAMPAVAVALATFRTLGLASGVLATALAVATFVPPPVSLYEPTNALVTMAAELTEVVPPGYRFAFAQVPMSAEGVAAPSRYLGWRSSVADLTIFGSEWAPGSEISGLVYEKLSRGNLDDWLDSLGQYRVSHVISATPEVEALFNGQTQLELLTQHENLALWQLNAETAVQVQEAGAEHFQLQITVGDESEILLPIGYSPGWHLMNTTPANGGEPHSKHRLGRSRNGQLALLPAPNTAPGSMQIVLRWQLPKVHLVGWLTTLLGTTVLTMLWARPSQVIARQTRRWRYQLHRDE